MLFKVKSCGLSSKRCIKISQFILHILSLLMITSAYAEDTRLFEQAKKHQIIGASSDVFLSKLESKSYLISVGVSEIAGTEPIYILNARTISKMNAKKALANFIHNVKITSSESYNTDQTRFIINYNGNKILLKEAVASNYESIITEKGEGLLRNLIDVGTWVTSDKKECFYSLAVELSK